MACRSSVFVLLLVVVEVSAASATDDGIRVVVNASAGRIAGKYNGTRFATTCAFFPPTKVLPNPQVPNVAAFMGIPYAAAPVNENRFRPPQPRAPFSGILEAKNAGPVCPQLPLNGLVDVPVRAVMRPNEDCLMLNVWAPVSANGSMSGARPVLVFFPGGGFIGGSGFEEMNCAFYDGEGLAADTNTIVVTANYRLGIFGFLADAALQHETGTTGNYGLQDQRAALAWVRANIAAFGGDSAQVTVMGQSAGATSVLHHLVLPRSQGLFSRAIAMSAYAVTWKLSDATQRGAALAADAGCGDEAQRVQCLRNVSALELLLAEHRYVFGPGMDTVDRMMAFGPVSDGFELPENSTFLEAMAAQPMHTPVMLGSTFNESNLFQCESFKRDMSDREALLYLKQKAAFIFPASNLSDSAVQAVLDEYREYPSPKAAAMAASTDLLFTCTADASSRLLSAQGSPVYRYALGRAPFPFRIDSCLGVPHTAALLSLFSKAFPAKAMGIILGNATDIAFAQTLVQLWGRFLHGKAPSAGWPQWDSQGSMVQLGSASSGEVAPEYGYHQRKCEVIRKHITY